MRWAFLLFLIASALFALRTNSSFFTTCVGTFSVASSCSEHSSTNSPYDAVATTAPTPTVTAGGYFIGQFLGEACVPQPSALSTYATLPTADFCVHGYNGGGSARFRPTPNVLVKNPAFDTGGNTSAYRIGNSAGRAYAATLINNSSGGFGTVNVTVKNYSAAALEALYATPSPRTHLMRYGSFIRANSAPFGIYDSGSTTINTRKANALLAAGVGIGRFTWSNFFDDLTQETPAGGYKFSGDDPAVAWMLANKIVPEFDTFVGPVQSGPVAGRRQIPMYRNPMIYASWCTAVAKHIRTTFPTVGATVPAVFGIPLNEPNASTDSWNVSGTDSPATYSQSAGGIGAYMKPCYAAIKAVYPNATVYGGELAMVTPGSSLDAVKQVSVWHSGASCDYGNCYDGFAVHISPVGVPGKLYNSCYYKNQGWSFDCITAMQAVETGLGYTAPHAIVSETAISSVANQSTFSGLDEPGQAWWLTQTLRACMQNSKIDACFWADFDEDATYKVGSVFYGGALIDTSNNQYRYKPAFQQYCLFAKFPDNSSCPTPGRRAPI